jgi:hypothetical protein
MEPPVIMPVSMLRRVDIYRRTLLSNQTYALHHDDQIPLPQMGRMEINKDAATWETEEVILLLE